MLKSPQVSAISAAVVYALSALAAASAQAQTEAQKIDRVEVTGSAIKRVDAETAVPVTVIKMSDLKSEGISTVEQVVARLAASQSNTGSSQAVGSASGGAAFADLRGIGRNKTLVLLNGRRIANNALDATAPDLNTIPFAALERVEVLRDGASSLYGTDAIGGVINFITKKSYSGGSLTLGYSSPEDEGGKSHNVNASLGYGDLSRDGFNIYALLDASKQKPIQASQRPYVDRQTPKTSGSPFPANYFQEGDSVNPIGPKCAPPLVLPDGISGCLYSYSRLVQLVPEQERMSGLVKASVDLGGSHLASLEYFRTSSINKTVVAGVPYGALTMNPGTKYFPGQGITPLPPASAGIDLSQPITVKWRDEVSGGRADKSDNTQQRLLLALDGTLANWDYKVGVSHNTNEVKNFLTGGYTNGTIITPGVRDGIINPFGAQDDAGKALIAKAAARGMLYSGTGKVSTVDASASTELGDWLGAGNATLALGGEFRKENFVNKANTEFAETVIASTGYDPAIDNRGSRKVSAVYAELALPLLKGLELGMALRHDRYNDFGNTTNPKFSLRYQPSKNLLLRGSYSTGFRAPSLYDLNAPQTYTNTGNAFDDPLRCPDGKPIPGAPKANNCGTQFMTLGGGNKNLRPETAKNATLGVVFEPVADLSLGMDLWWVRIKDSIGVLPETTIFGDPVKYKDSFRRAPDGSLSTDGSLCPGPKCGYIFNPTLNLGGVITNGIDASLNYRLRTADAGTFTVNANGTYVVRYNYQDEPGGAWNENEGAYVGTNPIFRWSHAITFGWSQGAYALGATNRYRTGYLDQNKKDTVPADSIWDVYGSWKPVKGVTLTAGVRNVFDTEPPFSRQNATFQTGYDPRFADAVGRSYYVRAGYEF
ncbi:TonB-dependent receptor [Paucibacter soli]|uniref:TonB-dependent receptor n=1 Tax=Paucibacter soli TaxID=3133433 RepID=UPI0030A9EF8C